MGDEKNTTAATGAGGVSDESAPRSEGQRLIRAVAGGVREIADRIGVSPPTISRWRRGDRTPDHEQRIAIEGALGIPARAWGLPPGAEVRAAASSSSSASSAPSSSASEVPSRRATLREIDEQIEGLDLDIADATVPRERGRLRMLKIDALVRREDLIMRARAENPETVKRAKWLRDLVETLARVVAGCDRCAPRVEAELVKLDLARPVQGALDEVEEG